MCLKKVRRSFSSPDEKTFINSLPIQSHLVLRLYPSVPVNTRTAHRTTVLPVGGGPNLESPVLIRKGENVAFCVYAMHRRTDLYGADAEKFRPERWEDETLPIFQSAVNRQWGYLPFNGGPRVCLGRKSRCLSFTS